MDMRVGTHRVCCDGFEVVLNTRLFFLGLFNNKERESWFSVFK